MENVSFPSVNPDIVCVCCDCCCCCSDVSHSHQCLLPLHQAAVWALPVQRGRHLPRPVLRPGLRPLVPLQVRRTNNQQDMKEEAEEENFAVQSCEICWKKWRRKTCFTQKSCFQENFSFSEFRFIFLFFSSSEKKFSRRLFSCLKFFLCVWNHVW